MNAEPIVTLVSMSDRGVALCAAAARISTTPGTAHDLFLAREGGARDQKLIAKVLSSGHRSLIEHQSFSIALDNVSVLVEQCLIEFRLSSFTVKSRRYVDFEQAGFFVPADLSPACEKMYVDMVKARFLDYGRLVAHGIPLEDARFVLPYCFFSSLYLTCNARELSHIISAMLYGPYSRFEELRRVGELLLTQCQGVLGEAFPLDSTRAASPALEASVAAPVSCVGRAQLLAAPQDPRALLHAALAFSNRFENLSDADLSPLVRDARPRELEALHYTFLLEDVSLACVTHIARHRIQSPMFEPTLRALNKNRHVLPDTVAQNPEARRVFENAFLENGQNAAALREAGLATEALSYLALSGNTVRVMLTMNARELLHFLKLRTCERAQWEIRALAQQMLRELRASYPELFDYFGPSCLVNGRCPEGRLSCGRPRTPLGKP
ncbi:MAG: FAD-dependent thymidylate synthase [Clostridia bacterium]